MLFARALPYIDRLLAKGECCTVVDVVEFGKSLLEEGEMLTSTFQARDMKQLIHNHYGESVTFAPNVRVNESDIFFSSNVSAADLAIKLKNQDIMREAGTKLREALLDVDFGLQDSFCDSADLKASWEKTMMPAPLLTFLGALFKVPKHKLFKSPLRSFSSLYTMRKMDQQRITNRPHRQRTADHMHSNDQYIERSLYLKMRRNGSKITRALNFTASSKCLFITFRVE